MVLLHYDKDNKKWIEITKEKKQEGDLYLDGFLKKKLDLAKKQQDRDFDVGGIVDGSEGTGKSTCASNIMIYMSDCKFDPRKHIIKSHEDAIKVLKETPDKGTVMFDEGYLLFYSADALTKHQKAITKIFSIIRQKNLFFLIVAPSFFRLASYFANDRTKFLINVYTVEGKRGYFNYWGHKAKDKLYDKGKRDKNYRCVRPTIKGRYSKCSMLDEEYKQIKRETLEEAYAEAQEKLQKKVSPLQIKAEAYKEIVYNNQHLSGVELAKLLNLSRQRISEIKQQLGIRTWEFKPKKQPLIQPSAIA